jgi:hypothetical protein
MKCTRSWPAFVLGLLAGLLTLPQGVSSQGTYRAVSADDVAALRFFQYFAKLKSGSADFEWSFAASKFTIKEGKGRIPDELLETLLGAAPAKTIEGKWKLSGRSILLSEIKGDGKPGRPRASFPIYRTAPRVIRIGHRPQFVFERVEKAQK